MAVTAKLRYLRVAPRKVRLVADIIRGKSTEEAQTILSFTIKKAAQPILKLLKSAIASAKNNFRLEEANLYISKIIVDEGPKYKRWTPRARGQASQIQKKTSHITIILDEIEKKAKKIIKAKTQETEKVEKIDKPEKAKEIKKEKSRPDSGMPRPRSEKGIKKIFRRKAF